MHRLLEALPFFDFLAQAGQLFAQALGARRLVPDVRRRNLFLQLDDAALLAGQVKDAPVTSGCALPAQPVGLSVRKQQAYSSSVYLIYELPF
jgi:hypothetical protein